MGKNCLRKRFGITGMHCAACASRAERALRRIDGVEEAAVNFAAAEATVSYRPSATDADRMAEALKPLGFGLVAEEREEEAENLRHSRHAALKRRTAWAATATLGIMAAEMLAHGGGTWLRALTWAAATTVVFGAGREFFTGAWRQARHGGANMDTLVALSTGIAYAFSVVAVVLPGLLTSRGLEAHAYFDSACGVITFILVGRLLEERARRSTAASLRELAGLRPSTALVVLPGGGEEERPVAGIRPGDTLRVRPGERVAVDGIVTEGESYIDESLMSGEPLPVHKSAGERVLAGTVNGRGSFCFRAEKVGGETVLARIVQLVRDAQGSKAPVQRLADRVAAVFVPAVITLSLCALAGWLLLSPADGLSRGLLAAVTVLVVACPCALGLATPTALMVGIGRAARSGILVRDAESLETARRIDTVVLDKTGTLTEGRPRVTAVHWHDGGEAKAAVLQALERRSEHPLAQAIAAAPTVAEAAARAGGGEGADRLTGFRAVPGRGVTGSLGGTTYFAGSPAFLAESTRVDGETLRRAVAETGGEGSLVCFASDDKLLAVAVIADPLRPAAAEAVSELRRQGIKVHLLSGDRESAVAAVAREAGIERWQGDTLPDAKAAYVARLHDEGRTVAMVGDGINDSAAMARADLGMAMGHGSDIVMDIAQMTLVGSDLRKVAEAIRLSRRTMRVVRQNLFWAFIYNILAIPVAAGAFYPLLGWQLDPMLAGAAMALSSLSVVMNSLRLRR